MRKLLEILLHLLDPDFTKLPPREAEELKKDLTTGTVPASEIDWDN